VDYNFKKIESKWQKYWLENESFKVLEDDKKLKKYILDMFPYPSSYGLHVGHISGYSATDIISRYYRMNGFNVLHPFGWDAFGLPAEQFALKTGKDPEEFTKENIKTFKRQLIQSGKGIAWEKELSTADSNYYKWTQWIFKKLYEHDLAEIRKIDVNWCPDLGTVLANDEIVIKDGLMFSDRGNYPVIKKAMSQWVLKITKYADRLLEDLEELDWPENLKEMQRNWIGKSKGAIISFECENLEYKIDVFTTRPDTIYGVTYLVLAPEHKLTTSITNKKHLEDVLNYIEKSKKKTDLERQINKEKTGVFTGSYAINPINKKRIPIFVADYVLADYATGSLMAVPAHDERDFEFAKKYNLEIIEVIKNDEEGVFIGDGIHINSDIINGMNNKEAIFKIISYLEKEKIGYEKNNYKLRDWVFSRQRYWGEPFPVLFDEDNNIHVLEDFELPLILPKMKEIKPSGTGQSPLANLKKWVNIKKDGKNFKRDTNTMPQLAGSAWYYIGYILCNYLKFTPLDSKEARKLLKKWLPVDLYVGGTEHAVGHLLYSRFWHKFLYDLKIVDSKEPFLKLVNQGMILGSDNTKMSKSKGNVVNPDEIIDEYGADSLRIYEMFMGPLEAEKVWQVNGVAGVKRFLDRIWRMFEFEITKDVKELDFIFNKTIKKVSEDIEKLSFNTAISNLMIFVNEVYKYKKISFNQALGFLKLLNPFAPHISEELNESVLKNRKMLIYANWPKYDEKFLNQNKVLIVVQVSGKLRAKIEVDVNLDDEELKKIALNQENVKKHLMGLDILKIIIIKNKLINIVVK